MQLDYQRTDLTSRSRVQIRHIGLHIFAIIMLILIIAALFLHWPVPSTGITVDITTGVVYSVAPLSAAAAADIQPGDRIVAIYDYRWEESDQQLLLFPLEWRRKSIIPIQVIHNGALRTTALFVEPPSQATLIERALWFAMGCICWLTGCLLGIMRRHGVIGTPLMSWFWLGVGGIVGVYNFVLHGSYPLTIVVQWLIISGVVPLGIYIHSYFPPRTVRPTVAVWMNRWLVGGTIFLQCAFLVFLAAIHPRLSEIADLLSGMVMPVLTLGLFANSLVLWSAYRQTVVAHVRRQIRLVGFACLIVALAWLTLRLLPGLFSPNSIVPGAWLFSLFALIPLAYLVGAVTPDLYRIDRVLYWFTLHLLTGSLLIGAIALIVQLLDVSGPFVTLWMVLILVIGYQPLHTLLRQVAAPLVQTERSTQPLVHAEHTMASTLDIDQIIPVLCQGIQATFGSPPLAFYRIDDEEPALLQFAYGERLGLPTELHSPELNAILMRCESVNESQHIFAYARKQVLNATDEALLLNPGIALWCPLFHSQGHLLGLLLLGMRDDLDPYRSEDLAELRRFLDAAQLALTNSATFREQQHAEQIIRELYRRVQQAQEETAANIARELHDEVINIGVRMNILSLEQALDVVASEPLRSSLQRVLDGERAVSTVLREVCERLHPPGIDDPFGLAGLLRHQVENLQSNWSGSCRFDRDGEEQPVASAVQREVLRVVREAVTNAMKHSNGTAIVVSLQYPKSAGSPIRLAIRDNGQSRQLVQPRRGSWGIRNMYESARAANAQLEFGHLEGGGLEVVMQFTALDMCEAC